MLLVAAVAGLAPPPVAAVEAGDSFRLLVSRSSDRSSPTPLHGAVVEGDVYVFGESDQPTSRVRFWLDDPDRTGSPDQTETNPPNDLRGGTIQRANALDTTDLADGRHSVTAVFRLTDGTDHVITAVFTVANDAPPVPVLVASPDVLDVAVDSGEVVSQQVDVIVSDGSSVDVTLAVDEPWLTADASSQATPTSVAVTVDARGLAAGSYDSAVTITAAGFDDVVLAVSLTVTDPDAPTEPPPGYELAFSVSTDRSGPASLDNAIVSGDIYVFTRPDQGVDDVQFWVDDPAMSGGSYKFEGNGPFDLAGTNPDRTAAPFDTSALTDGSHSVTAELSTSEGDIVVTAAFTVGNHGPVLVADPNPVTLSTPTDAGDVSTEISLSTTFGQGADYAAATDAAWLSVEPADGTLPGTVTVTADTSGLTEGVHRGAITVTAPAYADLVVPVEVEVREPRAADQVHLAWVDDPASTMTVVWRTQSPSTPSTVRYREAGTSAWSDVSGAIRPSGTAGTLHEATITSLNADIAYEYQVAGDGGLWSEVFTTRTAPRPGQGDVEIAFLADTGLVHRLDGLATGTQQVIEEVAAIEPDLVLAGGDYAYYNTETRYPTLDGAIDAWFDQMAPVLTRSPIMPTYGNHEVMLGERWESWAARFPTPVGYNPSEGHYRNYSFDVGDVHVVSIFAWEGNGVGPNTLAWIDADLAAARNRGQKWLLPFFHVAPFSDGSNHPSNPYFRAEFGPLFEKHGVPIALFAHDQSYERTYPLTDVPASNTPTSSSLSCYTRGDGVTWLKVGPGGKLSNQNGNFSRWLSEPAPSWTAVRNNTLHHIGKLNVSANAMEVEILGITGAGDQPILVDSFAYTDDACPAMIEVAPRHVALSAVADGGPSTATVEVTASTGSAAGALATDDADWLTATFSGDALPANLTLTADPAGLAPGMHTASVTVSADGISPVTLPVTLTVTASGHTLVMSRMPDRADPVSLEGQAIRGDVYVFVQPDQDVELVWFYVDEPEAEGYPDKAEGNGPFDLGGTASNGTALPFDTTDLSNGEHTVTAKITTDAGTSTITATFTVDNT